MYKKTLRGFDCTAVRHGVGWRVSAQDRRTGIAHTEYAEDINEAAGRVVSFLEANR
jgi:hypothetical protein